MLPNVFSSAQCSVLCTFSTKFEVSALVFLFSRFPLSFFNSIIKVIVVVVVGRFAVYPSIRRLKLPSLFSFIFLVAQIWLDSLFFIFASHFSLSFLLFQTTFCCCCCVWLLTARFSLIGRKNTRSSCKYLNFYLGCCCCCYRSLPHTQADRQLIWYRLNWKKGKREIEKLKKKKTSVKLELRREGCCFLLPPPLPFSHLFIFSYLNVCFSLRQVFISIYFYFSSRV